jgi:predicted ribosome quality control (RQC) complex YloA/Tae2 family protein
MKNEVSSLELKHLCVELNTALAGARIEKIYQPGPKTFVFSLRKTGDDKRLLRIDLPKFLYLTAAKEDMPARLTGFCGFLRKHVEGMVITGVAQAGSERIVRIAMATKEEERIVYLELFGKGNFIVCEEDNAILGCLEHAVFKDRVVKPGAFYELPQRELTLENLTLEKLEEIFDKAKENVSTALAVDVGIGGLIANEACLLSGVNPQAKKATGAEIEKLLVALQTLAKRKAQPVLVMRKGIPDEVVLFPMRAFEKDESVPLKSISEGLDKIFLHAAQQPRAPPKDKQLEKLRTIVSMQEQNAAKLETKADVEQKIGEFIYENYQQVKAILDELQLQMKHHSLQEIQQKVKGHKIVKEVDPKEGTVVLEF